MLHPAPLLGWAGIRVDFQVRFLALPVRGGGPGVMGPAGVSAAA